MGFNLLCTGLGWQARCTKNINSILVLLLGMFFLFHEKIAKIENFMKFKKRLFMGNFRIHYRFDFQILNPAINFQKHYVLLHWIT